MQFAGSGLAIGSGFAHASTHVVLFHVPAPEFDGLRTHATSPRLYSGYDGIDRI